MALLDEVKARLSITDEANDDTIAALIEDVKGYAAGAGVPAAALDGPEAYGLIAKGVADLWEAAGGKGAYSPIFNMRLIQLRSKPREEEEGETS